MISIELYHIDFDSGFKRKAIITESFKNLSYSHVLNGISECSFTLDIFHPLLAKEIFIQYKTQILIKDNKKPLWIGTFSHLEARMNKEGGEATIHCYSYLSHLSARLTPKLIEFTNKEQSEIIRSLIDYTQSKQYGNLNISYNTINTGIKRDRTYEYESISEAIIRMSRVVNGFDFDFIPIVDANGLLTQVKLIFYNLKKGKVRNDLPSFSVGDIGNIEDLGFALDDKLYNSIISEGAGFQDAIVEEWNNTSIQRYYTRREYFYPQKSVSNRETLQDNLNELASDLSTPSYVLRFKLNNPIKEIRETLETGDTININLSLKRINRKAGDLIEFRGQARILELVYNYDEFGGVSIIPKVGIKK